MFFEQLKIEIGILGEGIDYIRNRLEVGEKLEVVSPGINVREITLPKMTLITRGKEGEEVEAANPNSFVKITIDTELNELDMLRKRI